MICQKCGNEILDENTFCTKCGWCKDDVLRKKIKRKKKIIVISFFAFLLVTALIIYLVLESRVIGIHNIKMIKDYDSDTLVDDIECIQFGNYPQSDAKAESVEPIEWIVLDRDTKQHKALLISKYVLDSEVYNKSSSVDTYWDYCRIRTWLNDAFYNFAFNEEEQSKIVSSEISNDDNDDYDTIGGDNTEDKVFLLSIDEVRKYFKSNHKEVYRDQLGKFAATRGTAFAKSGKKTEYNSSGKNRLDVAGEARQKVEEGKEWAEGNSDFWLRSPGGDQNAAASVNYDGYLDTGGKLVHYSTIGVRPVIWVKY